MSGLKVSADHTHFEKDGSHFFWLADTVWSAFTNISEQDWEYYLKYRRQQGFNVLQINILPQWDRCQIPARQYPFPTDDGRKFDFEGGLQNEYFAHAKAMCATAVNYGFTLALVVLWSNFVPGTWASGLISDNIMPKDMIAPYCDKVLETFDEFKPVYVISGDTDLESPEAVYYYETALDILREKSPDTLKTMHIRGRYTYIPEQLIPKLDFYMFQSGHNGIHVEKPYEMPKEFREKYPAKPLVNAEPCYEQMGYSGNRYGRWDRFGIRRAAWMSILSGADAGITYGAHGIWNWQETGRPVNPAMGEGFDEAKCWQEALNFPGAWDYGRIADILAEKNVTELLPDDRVKNPTDEIRMATTADGRLSLIYVPYNTKLMIDDDLSGATVRILSMEDARTAYPEITVKDSRSTVGLCSFAQDVLVMTERKAAQ